ncbi:hypothetical protein F2Q68_00016542 [Brassica cretica]|uniref:Uncharacterized protein n=1 Tax=Brassica cretica TaxID=69181 RepID=A0A8S9HK08_BRACR|nr:hypothetical protein F2Q68_00016542 [Brassica cretica]
MAEMTIRPCMDGNRGADNVIRCQRAVSGWSCRKLGDCYLTGQPALFSVSSSVECHTGRLSRTTSLSSPFTHAPSSPFPMCGGLYVEVYGYGWKALTLGHFQAQCAASKPRYMAGAACT